MKTYLGMSSSEFLKKHTVPFEIEGQGLLGIKMRTTDNEPVCLLMDEEKCCTVYEYRPAACRYYPLGLMNIKAFKATEEEQHYFMVKEDHCQGHCEDNYLTGDEFREQQGVKEYDDYNWPWLKLVLKKKSSGPSIGKPSSMSLDFFFMCSLTSIDFVNLLSHLIFARFMIWKTIFTIKFLKMISNSYNLALNY